MRTLLPFSVLSSILLFFLFPLAAIGEDIRIMTFNIHIGIGMDQQLDLERIAETISNEQPDLVVLQEVDRFAERTQKTDQRSSLPL